ATAESRPMKNPGDAAGGVASPGRNVEIDEPRCSSSVDLAGADGVAAGSGGGAGVGGVAGVPPFADAEAGQVVGREAVAGEPGGAGAADDGVDVGHPGPAGGGGEAGAGLGAVLEEVLLPEGPAAEHARGAGLHRHLDLLEVVGVVHPGRQQDPGPLA